MVIISIMHVNNSICFQMLIILPEVVISLELLRANELEKIKLSFKWHQQPFNVWKCILSLVCELKTLRILTTILNVDKLVPSTSQLPLLNLHVSKRKRPKSQLNSSDTKNLNLYLFASPNMEATRSSTRIQLPLKLMFIFSCVSPSIQPHNP